MAKISARLLEGFTLSSPSGTMFLGNDLRGRIRNTGSKLLVLGSFALSAVNATASPITFASPVPTTAPSGAVTDGSTGALFNYEAVPAGAAGDALTSWSFYALNTNTVTPVIFNASGDVVGIGTSVTPTGVGVQTALFGLTQGTSVLAAGDSVGWYDPTHGTIALILGSGNPTYSEVYGGLTLGISADNNVGDRTYLASFTAGQVALTTPSAPAPGSISDGCTNCLFSYTPVTSNYNGQTLKSWSFYALNTNPAYPVIFGPNGQVIGYGQLDTPTSTGLQTFAYVPAWGSAVLQTGDTLGWYYPDQGSIAFSLTGGQGGTYAPFPQLSLGPDDVTTTPVPGRDYDVGFSTSESMAATPEPNYAFLVAMGLGTLVFCRRNARFARPDSTGGRDLN